MVHGSSYAEWSEQWWQWFMGHDVAGHPGVDDPMFDVTSGQSGNVWFLATQVDVGTAVPTPRTRFITIPAGTALFLGLFLATYALFARTFPMISPRLAMITLEREVHHHEVEVFDHEDQDKDFVHESDMEK